MYVQCTTITDYIGKKVMIGALKIHTSLKIFEELLKEKSQGVLVFCIVNDLVL